MNQPISNRFMNESLVHLEIFKIVEKKHPHSLKSGKNPHIRFFRIKYYLLARGIELSMKAFLFDHGLGVKKLKKIGHDLDVLLKELESKKPSMLFSSEKTVIKLLNVAYRKKGLEYENNIYRTLPAMGELAKISEEVINTLRG